MNKPKDKAIKDHSFYKGMEIDTYFLNCPEFGLIELPQAITVKIADFAYADENEDYVDSYWKAEIPHNSAMTVKQYAMKHQWVNAHLMSFDDIYIPGFSYELDEHDKSKIVDYYRAWLMGL